MLHIEISPERPVLFFHVCLACYWLHILLWRTGRLNLESHMSFCYGILRTREVCYCAPSDNGLLLVEDIWGAHWFFISYPIETISQVVTYIRVVQRTTISHAICSFSICRMYLRIIYKKSHVHVAVIHTFINIHTKMLFPF